mgnify:CR=1 FL=1
MQIKPRTVSRNENKRIIPLCDLRFTGPEGKTGGVFKTVKHGRFSSRSRSFHGSTERVVVLAGENSLIITAKTETSSGNR